MRQSITRFAPDAVISMALLSLVLTPGCGSGPTSNCHSGCRAGYPGDSASYRRNAGHTGSPRYRPRAGYAPRPVRPGSASYPHHARDGDLASAGDPPRYGGAAAAHSHPGRRHPAAHGIPGGSDRNRGHADADPRQHRRRNRARARTRTTAQRRQLANPRQNLRRPHRRLRRKPGHRVRNQHQPAHPHLPMLPGPKFAVH